MRTRERDSKREQEREREELECQCERECVSHVLYCKGSLRFAGDPNWTFYGKVSGDWKVGMCLQIEGAFKWERLPTRCDPTQATQDPVRLSTLRGDKWEYFRTALVKGYASGTTRPRSSTGSSTDSDAVEDKTVLMDKALQRRITEGVEEIYNEVLDIMSSSVCC
jgi:hypothetical protein